MATVHVALRARTHRAGPSHVPGAHVATRRSLRATGRTLRREGRIVLVVLLRVTVRRHTALMTVRHLMLVLLMLMLVLMLRVLSLVVLVVVKLRLLLVLVLMLMLMSMRHVLVRWRDLVVVRHVRRWTAHRHALVGCVASHRGLLSIATVSVCRRRGSTAMVLHVM